jgi:hypothetical protein
MARKSKTHQLAQGILGQHLSLALAAHLARTQLVPDPLRVYDGQHLSDTLNVVAVALARTAPVFVVEGVSREPRELTPFELEGASAKRGATVLLLKDGRALAGASIRRGDLRQAIAILKAIGLPELGLPPGSEKLESAPPKSVPATVQPDLITVLDEIDDMLIPPLIPGEVERAKYGALFIARHTPHGRVANLAMQLMSALHESRGYEDVPGGYRMALARLRAALVEKAAAAT